MERRPASKQLPAIHRTLATRSLPDPSVDQENHRRSVISLNFAIYFSIPKLHKQSLHPFGMHNGFKEERDKRHGIG